MEGEKCPKCGDNCKCGKDCKCEEGCKGNCGPCGGKPKCPMMCPQIARMLEPAPCFEGKAWFDGSIQTIKLSEFLSNDKFSEIECNYNKALNHIDVYMKNLKAMIY